MTTKYASGLYEYYPGAFSHHPDSCMESDKDVEIKEEKPTTEKKRVRDDIPTTMRKLKKHVEQCMADMNMSTYPTGAALNQTIVNMHYILHELEVIKEIIIPLVPDCTPAPE